MLLKSLRLENIRSYTNDNILFTPGSSLLLGDIGSGKTTVLLGIEFALFGLIRGDVSGTTLLRHGKSFGGVELCFSIDDKDIIIARKLKRKNDAVMQDAGYIIIDGKRIDCTPVELKSKILELCGYSEDLLNKNTSLIYRYTVYTPQEDMKAILFESKEERLDTLRRIFNIDKYKRIRENALNYAKELRSLKKILDVKISDLELRKSELAEKIILSESIDKEKSSLQEDLSAKTRVYDDNLKELKKYALQIDDLIALKNELTISDNNLKNKKSEIERISKELSIVDYRIREYENKLKDMGVIDQDEKQLKGTLQDAEEKLSKINIAKETIADRLKSKGDDLKNMVVDDQASLNAKRSALMKRLEEKSLIEKSLEDHKKTLSALSLEINSLNISKSNSEKITVQLKDLSTCPVCLQPVDLSHKVKIIDKEHANIIDAQRRLADMQSKYSDAEKHIAQYQNSLEKLRQDELDLREANIKLGHLTEKVEGRKQLEKDIEELKIKKDKLDKIDINKLIELISKNRKMLSNIEVRKHIEESLKDKVSQKQEILNRTAILNEEIKSLTETSNNIMTKVSSYADIEKDFKNKKSDIERLGDELKGLEIKMSSISKDLEIVNIDIKKLNEDISLKNKIKEKIIYVTELNHWISEHFISLTSTIEKAIMQKVHHEFDELFRKWFDIMMDTNDLDVRLDEEFTPVIMQNNYETEITNLSGGERTSVALAYRLALNKVINDFISTIKTKDILILDEPTDGFSTEQLDKMRDVFDELRMGQMIIVSHEAKMESYVQNIIRIVKNEHNSKVMT